MSRPSTDWPITRVSITGEGTVVEVVVDVDDVVVVSSVVEVDDVDELVVDGEVDACVVAGVTVAVVPMEIADVGVLVVPFEAHPSSSSGATKSVSRIDRRQRTGRAVS